MTKCHDEHCELPAVVRVFWPGQVPPPVFCAEHASKALLIARAIGCPVAAAPADDLVGEDA
jgi:hypothetical protein